MTGAPLVLDPGVRVLDHGRVLLGGFPGRLVRLREGMDLGALTTGGLDGPPRRLATTLVDSGLAHPRPAPAPVHDVTVVVPARDRVEDLERCLAALGDQVPVVVVDDASRDPAAVCQVAARHGARLVRLDVNIGPAGARNVGIAATTSELVALVDSDCIVPAGWLGALAGHLDDPAVAAVALRVRARADAGTVLARYAAARGPLDLGPVEGPVRPGSRLPYVPTAALLLRRSALAVPPFDPLLRYGEDVDLVWRLHDAGWTIRYDPRTVVVHTEPERWLAWLRRRHHYGTSAAPLARRHGSARLAPLVLAPWPTAAWLLLCSRRPLFALAAAAVPAARLHRALRRANLSHRTSAGTAAAVAARAVVATGRGLGGAGLAVTAPVLLAGVAHRPTRVAAVLALVAPPLLEHLNRKPALDPARWTGLRLVDDVAYASGVWRAAWADRSPASLRPRRRSPS